MQDVVGFMTGATNTTHLPAQAGSPQPQQPTGPATPHMSGSGRPCAKLRAHQTFALKCRYRPDGLAIATTSADQTTKLWSVTNNKMIGSYGASANKWMWDW